MGRGRRGSKERKGGRAEEERQEVRKIKAWGGLWECGGVFWQGHMTILRKTLYKPAAQHTHTIKLKLVCSLRTAGSFCSVKKKPLVVEFLRHRQLCTSVLHGHCWSPWQPLQSLEMGGGGCLWRSSLFTEVRFLIQMWDYCPVWCLRELWSCCSFIKKKTLKLFKSSWNMKYILFSKVWFCKHLDHKLWNPHYTIKVLIKLTLLRHFSCTKLCFGAQRSWKHT